MGNEEVIKPGEKEDNFSVLDRAERAAKEIKDGIAELRQLKAENEAIAARIALSGRTDTGVEQPKPAPMSNKEYAEKVLKGEYNVQK